MSELETKKKEYKNLERKADEIKKMGKTTQGNFFNPSDRYDEYDQV